MDFFPFALFTALILGAVIFLGPTLGKATHGPIDATTVLTCGLGYSAVLQPRVMLSSLLSLSGEEFSFLARDGERIESLRCGAAGSSPHKWLAFRVEGNKLGPPIDLTSFRNADGSLSFTVNTSTNTGYYYCVNAADEHEIYDKYVILTDGECRARNWM